MYQQSVTITSEFGMKGRLATKVIQASNKFKSEITFEGKGKKADGKSLLPTLSLGMMNGDELMVSADGRDEKEAVDAICSLIRQEGEVEQTEKELREKRKAERKPGLLSRLFALLYGRK